MNSKLVLEWTEQETFQGFHFPVRTFFSLIGEALQNKMSNISNNLLAVKTIKLHSSRNAIKEEQLTPGAIIGDLY